MDKFLDKYIFSYTQNFIGRASLTKDGLPKYSESEELFNSISHLIGVFLGLFMIIVSCIFGKGVYGMLSGLIFGLSLIVLYSSSSIYHGLSYKRSKTKRLFRIADHCSIFILIAGTCSPFIFSASKTDLTSVNWTYYSFIWIIAFLGILLLIIDMDKFKTISVIMYVIMGLSLFYFSNSFVSVITSNGFTLLVGGGLIYLIGFLFYGFGSKIPWMHSVFHVLCLIASGLHCVCIVLYTL